MATPYRANQTYMPAEATPLKTLPAEAMSLQTLLFDTTPLQALLVEAIPFQILPAKSAQIMAVQAPPKNTGEMDTPTNIGK